MLLESAKKVEEKKNGLPPPRTAVVLDDRWHLILMQADSASTVTHAAVAESLAQSSLSMYTPDQTQWS